MSWLTRLFKDSRHECGECGNPRRVETVPRCEGREGDVTVTFKDLPVLSCGAAGHARRYPGSEFGPAVIDRIFHSGSLAVSRARVKGLNECRDCGSRLHGSGSYSIAVSGRVAVPDAGTFEVHIQAPGVRCEGCGLEQVFASEQVSSDICDAMIAAFKTIQLVP